MEELVSVMMLVLEELREINTKLDCIKGIGVYGSINDLHDQLTEIDQSIDTLGDKIDEIRGSGVYDTISDVCDKLDNVENAVSSV